MARREKKPRGPVRLGIDLGTTRTVVAALDRGNYPVIGFTTADGDPIDYVPTLTAEVDGELVHGLAADAAARAGAPSLGSWKRLFGELGPSAEIAIGRVRVTLVDLATSFLEALRDDLARASNLPGELGDDTEVVVSVPANAHSTQRFLTLDAFRRAGFRVRAMINEPSAAGLEYAHRHRDTLNRKREHVVVYDLGGGTFDAALVKISGDAHDVVATSGVGRLGGDDFDAALLDVALEQAGIDRALGGAERAALLAECRAAKEAIHPTSRRIPLELAALGDDAPAGGVVLDVAAYYERVRPLVLRSMDALEPVLSAETDDARGAGITEAELAGIYVVGGASGLPLVPRVLRERFGRRVHRSPYPSAATAIGCAIAAGRAETLALTERLGRHLGVFREREGGASVGFDEIFAKGTPMPAAGEPPLVASRVYRAAHNVGHYRFVECGALDGAGGPAGDITPHAELRFPFAAELRDRDDLAQVSVARLSRVGPHVEERYEIDAAGVVAVTMTDLDTGYAVRHVL